MPAALRTNGTSTSTTSTLTRPSGVLGGDVMVAFLHSRQTNSTATVLAGWTYLGKHAITNGAATVQVAMKVAAGPVGGATTEPTSFTPMAVGASNLATLFTFQGDTVEKDPTKWGSVVTGPASSPVVTAHSMIGGVTAAGDAYVGMAGTGTGAGTYTLPATAGTTRLGPLATGTNNTASEAYATAWVPTTGSSTPDYLAVYSTAIAYATCAVRVPQAATVTPPTGSAFPWKGVESVRPWLGLGTDEFKGLAA